MKFINVILILTLILSCNEKKDKKVGSSENETTTELKVDTLKNIAEKSIPEQYFQIDSLRNKLKTELENLKLNSKFALKTEPKTNIHDSTVTDTIKTHTYKKNKILSYKYQDREWIYSAKIINPKFIFIDSIRIGMPKLSLEKIIRSELKSDLIKIGNLEGTSIFIFDFKNDTLKTIEYQGYVD